MVHQYEADTTLEKLSENKAKAQIKLDLNLENIFQVSEEESLAETLRKEKETIRQEVFQKLNKQIFPQILEDHGNQNQRTSSLDETTSSKTHANTHISTSWKQSIENGQVSLNNEMEIQSDLQCSEDLNPLQIVNHARQGIVAKITENILQSLDYANLEEVSSENEFQVAEKSDYEVRELDVA